MKTQRWQDWATLVLGAWLFISPFWMGSYGDVSSVAAWNSYIFGAAVFILSWTALSRPERWEEWINLAIGIWLIISPFVLRFNTQTGATWNHVIVGLLIGGEAAWALLQYPTGHPSVERR